MNLEWLKWVLDEEVENGTIEGYVTNTRSDVQLQNYLEEQRRDGAVSAIQTAYEKVAILTNMYVEEEGRGNGIGSGLLENFIDNATVKGAEAIVLVADTVETNMFDLVEWYETYDFKLLYGERDKCPVMVKVLR